MTRGLVIVGALLLGWAMAANAAPLDLKQVSGQATWVGHLDADAVRTSAAVGNVYQRLLDSSEEMRHRVNHLRQDLGLNLTTGVHGITLYGPQLGKRQGVVLIHADFDRAVITKKIAAAPDHKTSTYRDREMHYWNSMGRGKHARSMAGAFDHPGLIVLASNIEELKAAIDVLDGREASMSGKDSPLAAPVQGGAMLVLRAVGLDKAELPYKSPLITQSESFRLAVSESRSELVIQADLKLKSAEVASQVKSILEGLRAMAELQGKEDVGASALAKSIQTTINDKTVLVECRATPEQVLQQVRGALREARGDSESRPHRNGNPEK